MFGVVAFQSYYSYNLYIVYWNTHFWLNLVFFFLDFRYTHWISKIPDTKAIMKTNKKSRKLIKFLIIPKELELELSSSMVSYRHTVFNS